MVAAVIFVGAELSWAQTKLPGMESFDDATGHLYFISFPPCSIQHQVYGIDGKPVGSLQMAVLSGGTDLVPDRVISDLLSGLTRHLISLNRQANLWPDFINALIKRENDIRNNDWNDEQEQYRDCYATLAIKYLSRQRMHAEYNTELGRDLYEVYILPFDEVPGPPAASPAKGSDKSLPIGGIKMAETPLGERLGRSVNVSDGLVDPNEPGSNGAIGEKRYSAWKDFDISIKSGSQLVYDLRIEITGIAANALLVPPEFVVEESTEGKIIFFAAVLPAGFYSMKINAAAWSANPQASVRVSGYLEDGRPAMKSFQLPLTLKGETDRGVIARPAAPAASPAAPREQLGGGVSGAFPDFSTQTNPPLHDAAASERLAEEKEGILYGNKPEIVPAGDGTSEIYIPPPTIFQRTVDYIQSFF